MAEEMCSPWRAFPSPMGYTQRASYSPPRQWMKCYICKEEPKYPFFSCLLVRLFCSVFIWHNASAEDSSSGGISRQLGGTRSLKHTVWEVISELLPHCLPSPSTTNNPILKFTWSLSLQLDHPFLSALPVSPAWANSEFFQILAQQISPFPKPRSFGCHPLHHIPSLSPAFLSTLAPNAILPCPVTYFVIHMTWRFTARLPLP